MQPRVNILRALHAEGKKRGLDHGGLREIASQRFGVSSVSALTEDQMKTLYRDWTGQVFHSKRHAIRNKARRHAAGTAGRKDAPSKVEHLVSGDDLEMLGSYAARLGWGTETLGKFIRRQLGGRETIRTVADLNKVLWPMKRILRSRNTPGDAR